MFARVTSAKIFVDKIDQLKKIYKENVVPAAKKQRGFRGICLMVNRKTGEGLSIGYWDTEEDALANETNLFYQQQVARFLPFYSRDPIREGYEVLVQE
jgi:heme-degrading monooxygenase HmoA